MKFRCVHNSIRIRIRKSDMQQLADNGKITETISFPAGNTFGFSLSLNENIEVATAVYKDNFVQVLLPHSTAHTWIKSSEISLAHEQTLTNGETLHLLIEKDLPCLDRPEENKSDTFEELAEKTSDVC